MEYPITTEGKYQFVETKGQGETLILLHGLFGTLDNFQYLLKDFGKTYNVIAPIMPVFELPLRHVSVAGLVDFMAGFVDFKKLSKFHILGNSLGGHIALLYALKEPSHVLSIILTGSSGLYEKAMGTTFPRREDKEYIRKKIQSTFYDPASASDAMIDEVFAAVNDRGKVIRAISMAKSALRHNLADKLGQIQTPTLLIWGKQDAITPPFVGEKFKELLPNATLFFIDKCGHAPMLERPEEFNKYLTDFLNKLALSRG
ncbi:MAG: alpha/beta hydrolase [Bacteroidetes bacterium]|nr:alpha/beta hydrolase [Bacteroidota bacterium]